MFRFGKHWISQVLIEGQKDAELLARQEHLKAVDPNFDDYPVEVTLPKKQTFWEAVKKSVKFSEANIYNMFYKYK